MPVTHPSPVLCPKKIPLARPIPIDSLAYVAKKSKAEEDANNDGDNCDADDPFWRAAQPGAIPEQYDIPIGLVNHVLYSGNVDEGDNNANGSDSLYRD
jgi:hypothetical protein